MSVIAARKTETGWHIAADSIVVYADHNRKSGKKLFNMSHCVFGGSGLYSEMGLMRSFLLTHKVESEDEIGMVRLLSEFAKWKGDLIDSKAIENHYIFGLPGGGLFQVERFGVVQIVDYCAIGYGCTEALTALALGHDPVRAVEVACEVNPYCAAPVVSMTTKDLL